MKKFNFLNKAITLCLLALTTLFFSCSKDDDATSTNNEKNEFTINGETFEIKRVSLSNNNTQTILDANGNPYYTQTYAHLYFSSVTEGVVPLGTRIFDFNIYLYHKSNKRLEEETYTYLKPGAFNTSNNTPIFELQDFNGSETLENDNYLSFYPSTNEYRAKSSITVIKITTNPNFIHFTFKAVASTTTVNKEEFIISGSYKGSYSYDPLSQ